MLERPPRAHPEAPSDLKEVNAARFYPGRNTVLLNVAPEDLGTKKVATVAQEHGLEVRPAFHFTVIGFAGGKEIAKVLKTLPPPKQTAILKELKRLTREIKWEFVPQEAYYHIAKEYPGQGAGSPGEKRESIIQLIEIPGLENFYKALNQLLGTQLTAPLPHATLYAKSSNPENQLLGIAVSSEADFQALSPQRLLV